MKKSCLLMILLFSVIFAFAASDKPTGAVGRWGVILSSFSNEV